MTSRQYLRRLLCATAALAMVPLAVASALAQPPAPLLVDVEWLAAHLHDRGLIVLHVGDQSDYDAGHIPGARRIAEQDVSRPHDMAKMAEGDLMLELPPTDVLRERVAALGISDDSRIVVYAGNTTALQSSTRIVFTLDYLGLGDRTSLLNGGMTAWTRSKQAASTAAVPPAGVGTLASRPTRPVVASVDLVKSLPERAHYRLVDARAAVFYRGIEPSMGGAAGHIPGAISLPFSEIADNQQRIDRQRVETLFRAAGIAPGDTVVAYCHVGQQATAVVFAARLLGHPVLLYDGSFQEWSSVLHLPVEKIEK